jgi:hypothetical protein
MFMVAGGHFAGAIVRVSRGADDDADEEPNPQKKKKPKKPRPDTEVLNHKTFHRYTSEPLFAPAAASYLIIISSSTQAGWVPRSK